MQLGETENVQNFSVKVSWKTPFWKTMKEITRWL